MDARTHKHTHAYAGAQAGAHLIPPEHPLARDVADARAVFLCDCRERFEKALEPIPSAQLLDDGSVLGL